MLEVRNKIPYLDMVNNYGMMDHIIKGNILMV